jgi:hypothetical protein
MLAEFLGHRRQAQGPLLVEQSPQHGLDAAFTLVGCQLQDAQVLLGGPLRLLLPQQVVGLAEAAGGEQVGPVAVIGKGSRLADQPVDDVSVLNLVLALAPQTG